MGKLLTMSELEARRESAALIAAAESTLEAAKIADRERSGLLMRQNGTVVRKRKRDGVYVSAIHSKGHSTSVTKRSQVQVRPGAEVLAWDAMVRADRQMVAAGCKSLLVKVVKGNRPATLAETAHIIITPAPITAPDTDQPIDIMGKLKAIIAAREAE